MPFPNPDTQFKPGWKGGPGRPKRPVSTALEAMMTPEFAKALAHTMAAMSLGDKKALKGRKPEIAWMKELLDRTEGKVVDRSEVKDVTAKTPEERAEVRDDARRKLGGIVPGGEPDGTG